MREAIQFTFQVYPGASAKGIPKKRLFPISKKLLNYTWLRCWEAGRLAGWKAHRLEGW
jgi:hypothetical protein